MKQVLILGNGTSRLEFSQFINDWKGEIWACNNAYKDETLPPITRLTGHIDILKEAYVYKKEKGLSFEITTNSDAFEDSQVTRLTVDPSFIKDSGTTFVAQALHDGYDKIYVCGFDMGGPDVYAPNHQKRNVSGWLRRWKKIAQHPRFFDTVEFIGYDHTTWLKNPDFPTNYFSNLYTKGKPHLINVLDFDRDIFMLPFKRQEHILIVGNGGSRGKPENKEKIMNYKGKVWGCNYAFREMKEGKLPFMERVFSVHEFCIVDYWQECSKPPRPEMYTTSRIMRRLPPDLQKAPVIVSPIDKGWNSGNLAIACAIYEGYPVDLVGFDFGGIDIYDPSKKIINGLNFKRIFDIIVKKVGEGWVNFL